MSTAGRASSRLSHFSLYLHIYSQSGRVIFSPCSSRMLSMTSRLQAESRKPPDDVEETSGPIKFSTSKASHRSWNVSRSLGSTYQRPWWKVLPISFIGMGFLLWCVFRKETEIDESLEKHLYDSLLEDEKVVENKP